MIPQIIVLCLVVFNLGITAARHGEIETREYNFFVSLLAQAITLLLLYWGGFFDGLLMVFR